VGTISAYPDKIEVGSLRPNEPDVLQAEKSSYNSSPADSAGVDQHGERYSLREVVEAIETLSDDCVSYLDPDSGEIITVTEEERRLAEDESLDDVPEWQRKLLLKIRVALQSDRFLQLPDRFDIHEWSIMEEFARGQDNDRIRQELLDAIHGAAPFECSEV